MKDDVDQDEQKLWFFVDEQRLGFPQKQKLWVPEWCLKIAGKEDRRKVGIKS
jgi:hypothetical protein